MNAETPLLHADEDAVPARFARPAFLKGPWSGTRIRNLLLGLAAVSSALATVYWLFIASDRYVSEADVVVQRTQLPGAGGPDLGGLLSGFASSGNRADQMLLRDHLLSVDMLKKLDKQLHLRAHYSDWHHDPLSRLWRADTPMEKFEDYFQNRVRIDYDDYDGVLEIRAEAFDPKTAHDIVTVMMREGEDFMNDSDHKLAMAQVDFLEDQVERMSERNARARQAVIDFQNREGMVSPEDSLRSVEELIAQLSARKSALETQMTSLQSYLVSDHPDVVAVRQQIAAIDAQIATERGKATAPGNAALNRKTEKFQRLQQEATFAQALYQTTLAALEKGKIDASRTVKKISVMQSPTTPEIAEQPRRAYNAFVFTLVAFLLAGISMLLVSIVRDHFD